MERKDYNNYKHDGGSFIKDKTTPPRRGDACVLARSYTGVIEDDG